MKKLFLLICCAVTFLACNREKKPEKLPFSKGLPSELLVVADPSVMQSDLRDSIDQVFKGQVPGLNQAEDYFRSSVIAAAGYDRVFTLMHSQVFIRIDKNVKTAAMGVARDVKARPQIQLLITAPNLEEMRSYLYENKERIQRTILDFQLDRMASIQRSKYSKKVSDDLHQVAGYRVCMPEDMRATKKGKHFLWGGTNRNEKDLNFVFYTIPWDGRDITDARVFASIRDSVMKENIPGSRPDQWMTTVWEKENPVILLAQHKVAGRRQTEVRGLWEMRNGALGGPFVSLAYIDTVARKVIVSEGFVYSPRTEKRDLVRTLEAAMRTLKKG